MADTNFRGPVNSMGALEIQAGTSASISPLDGPSGFYQAVALLDPRTVPFAKDGTAPGRVPAFLNNGYYCTVDQVPQATSTTALAAAQAATTTTPLALATTGVAAGGTTAAQIAVGVPFIPMGTTVVTTVIALDFGFTVGTTTANSTVVAVPDNSLFTIGQWLCIGNVGNSSFQASLLTQVLAISTSNQTGINVSPAPLATLFAPIGAANLLGAGLLPPATQFGPSTVVPNAVAKVLSAGLLRLHNPREMLARNIVTEASTSVGGTATILITGYDVWGQYMTELLSASGTTLIGGKKGFKYLLAAAPQQSGAASYTLGIGDTFSFPMRSDEWQQLTVWAGQTAVTNNVGWIGAVTTTANNTTGDVRGTVTLSTNAGAATPISAPATTNGTTRLVIYQSPAVDRVINANPNSYSSLFGVTNSTT